MRDWTVGGALLEGDEGLLLVRNRRRSGALDWSPPGGVIDPGEPVRAGLAREVEEETGLVVTRWSGPVYEVEAVAADMGWRLRVEVHQAVAWSGDLHVDDPDGIVVDARFVPVDGCAAHLAGGHPWVREPLGDWLAERWTEARRYRYEVKGADPTALVVIRLGP